MLIPISGYKISVLSFREFLAIYKDIFILNEYSAELETKTPFIIDCGAHIGISILKFKKNYPKAKIIAFEANPSTFEVLKKNISQNNLKQVEINNKAVSNKNGNIPYYVSKQGWGWGDAGVKNFWYNKRDYRTIKVPSVRLSSYITRRVDLLKIDIEGMELIVLKEIEKKLGFVSKIIMEFHGSIKNKENRIEMIIKILKKNKFKYEITHPVTVLKPFKNILKETSIIDQDKQFFIIRASK